MENKTRIALCLSGEPRSTMASFSYIYESFLQENPNYEVEIYIHSWKGFRALELYKPKNYLISNIDTHLSFINFLNSLNFSSKKVIESLSSYTSLTHNIHPLKNVFLMYSSIKECFSLIDKKYDLYIRCRPDLFLEGKINLVNLLPLFKSGIDIITGTKYNPNLNQFLIDDQLAICNYKGFEIYSNTILNIEELISQSQSLSPEVLLETHLNNNNVKLYNYFFNHHLIKGSNIFSSYKNFKDE
jgi:hypothetical protein